MRAFTSTNTSVSRSIIMTSISARSAKIPRDNFVASPLQMPRRQMFAPFAVSEPRPVPGIVSRIESRKSYIVRARPLLGRARTPI